MAASDGGRRTWTLWPGKSRCPASGAPRESDRSTTCAPAGFWRRTGLNGWVIRICDGAAESAAVDGFGEPLRGAGDRLHSSRVPHLRRLLRAYVTYYSTTRPHQSLNNNSPQPRVIDPRHVAASSPCLRSAGFIIATSAPPDHLDRDPTSLPSSGPAGCRRLCGAIHGRVCARLLLRSFTSTVAEMRPPTLDS
jgi:hypothetical protein